MTFDGIKAVAANMPAQGELGSYEADMFKQDFPQFTKSEDGSFLLPEHMLEMFISNANSSVLPSRWGEMWRYAAGLHVAHFVSMYLQTYSEGSASAGQAAGSGRQIGVVQEASLGIDTVKYDTSSVTAGTVKWGAWNATVYGQQLVTLARMAGMGGTYVI